MGSISPPYISQPTWNLIIASPCSSSCSLQLSPFPRTHQRLPGATAGRLFGRQRRFEDAVPLPEDVAKETSAMQGAIRPTPRWWLVRSTCDGFAAFVKYCKRYLVMEGENIRFFSVKTLRFWVAPEATFVVYQLVTMRSVSPIVAITLHQVVGFSFQPWRYFKI